MPDKHAASYTVKKKKRNAIIIVIGAVAMIAGLIVNIKTINEWIDETFHTKNSAKKVLMSYLVVRNNYIESLRNLSLALVEKENCYSKHTGTHIGGEIRTKGGIVPPRPGMQKTLFSNIANNRMQALAMTNNMFMEDMMKDLGNSLNTHKINSKEEDTYDDVFNLEIARNKGMQHIEKLTCMGVRDYKKQLDTSMNKINSAIIKIKNRISIVEPKDSIGC